MQDVGFMPENHKIVHFNNIIASVGDFQKISTVQRCPQANTSHLQFDRFWCTGNQNKTKKAKNLGTGIFPLVAKLLIGLKSFEDNKNATDILQWHAKIGGNRLLYASAVAESSSFVCLLHLPYTLTTGDE